MKYGIIAAMIFTLMTFALAIGYFAGCNHLFKRNKIHVLEKPLKLDAEDANRAYYLPAGTTLYFDKAMPEGFDRYYIYVNVFGTPLDVHSTPQPSYISPINARSIE